MRSSMMQFILSPLIFLLFLSFATAHADLSNNTFVHDIAPDDNDLAPSSNRTLNELRDDLRRRANDMRGCDVARHFQPYVFMECTEWCDLKDYGHNNVLRYHVRLTGLPVDWREWCILIQQAINLECGWERPFWQCNYDGPDTRAPLDRKLGIYFVNGWSKNVEYANGVNIRFDWWGWWAPRDAMHDCVAGAMRLATCSGIHFANGRHCIPVLHSEPNDSDEFHDESVSPEGCHWASEVPEESR